MSVWRQTLPPQTFGIDDNLFELEVDSITAVSLLINLEKVLGRHYPISFLLENPSIRQQAAFLAERQFEQHSLLISLGQTKTTTPLYLAASGLGDRIRFNGLAATLSDACCLNMLQPPTGNESSRYAIEDIAALYARLIMERPTQDYFIGGFSIGGITALAAACILAQQGKPPLGIILLDTVYPRWPLQSPSLFKLLQKLSRFFYLNKISINGRRLDIMLADPGINVQLSALSSHTIKDAGVPVHLILTRGMWMFRPLLFSSWSRIFKDRLQRHSMPGLHGAMFRQPYLEKLADIIKSCLCDVKN